MTAKARHFFAILLIASLPYSLPAQFTIEQILSAPMPTELTISEDGQHVAWVFNAQGVRNIWLYNSADKQSKQLTSYTEDDGQALGDLQFSPDGESIYYVRGGAPNRAGEIPNPTSDPDGAERAIHSVDIATREVLRVAEASALAISPDGKWMAYMTRGGLFLENLETDSTEARKAFDLRGSVRNVTWNPVAGRHVIAFANSRGDHGYICTYDLESNKLNIISPSVDHDQAPCWSPNGDRIAFMRVPNNKAAIPFTPHREGLGWSIWVADHDDGTVSKIWESGTGPGSVFRFISGTNQLFWSADDHIVFPWEGDGWTHLYSVPSAGGDAVCLSPGEGEVQFVSQSDDRQHIYFSSGVGDIDRQHIWRVAPASPSSLVQLTEGDGVQWSPRAANGVVYCLGSSGTTPAHPYRLDQNNHLFQLAPEAIPESFPSDMIAAPEPVIITATDGMQIHAQLFKPKNYHPDQEYPVAIFFHGGSRRQMLLGFHHSGYYHNAFSLSQYFANHGYLALSVNYRSGIGYGMEFREALEYGANGASEFNDVLGAGLYMKSRPDVDGDRIGLWGGSYGGYLTALGLSRASDLFAAGVDIHGVHDWNVVIKNFVQSYDPAKSAEVAAKAYNSSPVAFLDGWKSPVLFIHGDDDRNVPFSETVDIVESLRRRGVYHEQLIFPDEVHGFLLHRNWINAYKATIDFFDRFVKGKEE